MVPEAASECRSIAEASEVSERAAVGYSATACAGCCDCLELASFAWHVQPLAVEHVESSFFAAMATFPAGSVAFDSARLA